MRKLTAMLLVLALGLCGCSLAVEENGADLPVSDQLVGMYVTVSTRGDDGVPVDHWDAQAMGMEPLHLIPSQGQRLSALRVQTHDTTDDGVSDPAYSWEFPGDCGLTFLSYYEPAAEENEGFWSFVGDPELSGGLRHTSVNDEGTKLELEATVYVADTLELGELALYLNPVYQTPEGEVYALGTAPVGHDGATMGGTSLTVSQQTEVKLGDGVETCGGSVKLNIEQAHLPGRYVILEMDPHNNLLRHSEYTPDNLPETYTPGPDAAYLILEARSDGKTTRAVYSPDDETAVMDTFRPGRFGICIKGGTTIDWEGAK